MSEPPTDCPSLWSSARRGGSRVSATDGETRVSAKDKRSPFEHDYDRLLFSSPVRRLADKTQVFPLDLNDSVRTRLTHSHEVSNLARSLGHRLVREHPNVFGDETADKAAPIMLASAGLAHDLGNPPFGHQGEIAIRRWFESKAKVSETNNIFAQADGSILKDDLQCDFLNFEGNAQTLRLIARLQVSSGGYGLDLTAGTLAALMKYNVPASKSGKGKPPPAKKPGYLTSESDIVNWLRGATGLAEGQRHPLAWLMEACDDIAYCVLDIEDAMKKWIVSPEDILAHLQKKLTTTEGKRLTSCLERDFDRSADRHSLAEAREIKASYLRARLITTLMDAAADAFISKRDDIFAHSHSADLLSVDSERADIHKALKAFAYERAYQHPSVLRTELEGAIAITKLLDWFWDAITSRDDPSNPASPRSTALASYIYKGIMSDNYRRLLEHASDCTELPLRYRELQLLTDMVSGMTDGFVMHVFRELEPLAHA